MMEHEAYQLSAIQQVAEKSVDPATLIGAGLVAAWWLSNPRRRMITYYTIANVAQAGMPFTGIIGPAALEIAKHKELLPATFSTPLSDPQTSIICGATGVVGAFYAGYQHGPFSEMYARGWNSIQHVQYSPLLRIAINAGRSAQAACVYSLPILTSKWLMDVPISQAEKVVGYVGAASISIAVLKALAYRRYGPRTFFGFYND